MASLNFVKIIAGLYHLPFSTHPLGPFKTRYQLTCRLGFLLNLIFLWHLVDRLGGFHFRLIGHRGRFVRSRLFCSLFFFSSRELKRCIVRFLEGWQSQTIDNCSVSTFYYYYLFKDVLAAGSAIFSIPCPFLAYRVPTFKNLKKDWRCNGASGLRDSIYDLRRPGLGNSKSCHSP